MSAHSPSARANHPALRSCWHPVAYSEELGDGPVPTDLLGEPLVLWRDSAGHGPRVLRPLRPPGDRALARNGRGGRDRLPVPRLALRHERRLHRHPAARRPHARSGQGARDVVPLRRSATASSGSRSRSRAGRCPTSPSSSRTAWRHGDVRAVSVEVRLLAPGGELHRLRPLPVRPSRACSAIRSGPSCRATRCAPRATFSTTRSSGPRRRTPTTSRCSPTRRRRRPSAAAATSSTSRTRSCCGSAGAGRRGCCTSSPPSPSREDECRGFLRIGRNYNLDQPDDVLRDFEDVIFDQDKRIVESQRPEQVPVRPRRRAAPEVRRGRGRLPPRDADGRSGSLA